MRTDLAFLQTLCLEILGQISNSIDPDQSDLCLYYLPGTFCKGNCYLAILEQLRVK